MSFMIRKIKSLFTVILTLLAGLSVSLLFCALLVTSIDVRPLAIQSIQLFSDYKLQIEEPVYVDVYPELNLKIIGLTLSEKKLDQMTDFVEIGRFDFTLDTELLMSEGQFSGDINLQEIDLHLRLVSDQLTNLDRALASNTNLIGRMTGEISLSGEGNSISELMDNLNGKMNMELTEGQWLNYDIWHQLRVARSIYKREGSPEQPITKNNSTFSIKASGPIESSIFKNADFLMKMPYTLIHGRGELSLIDGLFDYSLRATFEKGLTSILNLSEDESLDFSSATLPIRVRSDGKTVTFRPDIEEIFRDEVESTLNKQNDNLKNKIRNNLFNW
jgi:uncharacterized protein involved in outer membrane biogenesis